MDIYLAGAEVALYCDVLHALDYPFRLTSYFYLKEHAERTMAYARDDGAKWTMDSGLFSMMFGSEQGTLKSLDDYMGYAKEYVDTMLRWKWQHAIVECDVQRVLGVEETFRIRDEVMRPSGLEVIYVWHIPEGEDGLRKLAATEKRIALSVPELRQVFGTGPTGGGRVRTALIRLIQIAREAGPAKIHLLGCTEGPLMRLDADSCDSTSWEAGRFGRGHVYRPSDGALLQTSIYSPRWQAWQDWCKKNWSEEFVRFSKLATSPHGLVHGGAAMTSACSFLMFMEAVR